MNTTDLTRPGRASTFLFALLALAGAALMLAFVPAARAATSFNDPAGDSGTAADITAVDVSDSDGLVTFVVTASGLKSGDAVWAWLDTDRNPATGDPIDGTEYGFEFGLNGCGTTTGWSMGFWNGTYWECMTPTPTMSVTGTGDTRTITFSSADFGGTTGFDFYLMSNGDSAPDTGVWTYMLGQEEENTLVEEAVVQYVPQAGELAGLTGTGAVYVFGEDNLWHYLSPQAMTAGHYDWNLITWYGELTGQVGEPIETASPPGVAAPLIQTPVVKPVINTPFTTPAMPVAGKTFTVSFVITDPNSGALLTKAAMICDPRVNGVVLKHSEHFTNGIATLSFKIPKTAKGKTLQVHLKMRVENDVGTTRVATFRIS